MSLDFDQFPTYNPIVKDDDKLSDIWTTAFSSFLQTLKGYLSQNGMLIPLLTVAQRNLIKSPQEGQMIYVSNATIGPPRSAELQIWQVKAGVGAWRTVTTVP